MRAMGSRLFWGVLLLFAGVLLLLEAFGVTAASPLWALLFLAAGAVFLHAFLADRGSWWAAIPGFALVGLAATSAWETLAPRGYEEQGGALLLVGIGLGFLAVYLSEHARWWAVIPGGAILSVAVVAFLAPLLSGATLAGILFLGLGLTFGLLVVLPTPGGRTSGGRMLWPIAPAALGVFVGALVAGGAGWGLAYLWPVALILGGLYLVFRASGGRTPRPRS